MIDIASDIDAASEDPVGISAFVLSTEQVSQYRATGRRISREIEREGVSL